MQMRGLQVLKHHEKNFNLCANQHLSLFQTFCPSAQKLPLFRLTLTTIGCQKIKF